MVVDIAKRRSISPRSAIAIFPMFGLAASVVLSGTLLSGTLERALAQAESTPPASVNAGRAAPPADVAPADPIAQSAITSTSDWRASKLIGATLSNDLGESVGSVKDVIIDGDGKVVAVMVAVGGFLGLGESDVAIGLRHLTIAHLDVDRLEVKTSLSRKAIEQAAALAPTDNSPLPGTPSE